MFTFISLIIYFRGILFHLFIHFKILSLNNFSKLLSPNLISNFQNPTFHVYIFNHHHARYYYHLFVYLFLKFYP